MVFWRFPSCMDMHLSKSWNWADDDVDEYNT